MFLFGPVMNSYVKSKNYGKQIPARSITAWKIAQVLVWVAGTYILFCLFFSPAWGITLFWNSLIPIAPALFVIGIGVWRNICPLATTILMPRRLGLSKKKILSFSQIGKLNLAGTVALFLIVPLRHPVFNNSGKATALMIVVMAIIGITLGLLYEWKSAWCSGLCPIHPVEKLYGTNTLVTAPNAHCQACMKCVTPCPDSTPNIHPESTKKTIYHQLSGLLIIGGLPGFIWGWFQVPDDTNTVDLHTILSAYQLPVLGLFVTLSIYGILSRVFLTKYHRVLISVFAAASVSCYYWYRIPSLFGFGKFASDGLLINLKHIVPQWIISGVTGVTTLLFFFLLVFRDKSMRSWLIRPQYHSRNAKA